MDLGCVAGLVANYVRLSFDGHSTLFGRRKAARPRNKVAVYEVGSLGHLAPPNLRRRIDKVGDIFENGDHAEHVYFMSTRRLQSEIASSTKPLYADSPPHSQED